ncbi:hypothetical protein Q765_12995 [Flavobacterium rivuli WB 3.3-2 = DSM 21788]|uniref:Uncharacterized protein n=1 Tax=Flavobacterium rivuli WB 3.3-2 = DSM 21788 TaxID=1121895 RepID=A0A0A2M2X6_9FLAO|nr:hypothetical protein [Flavobacterium rivuli]KGO85976.1 hypothetical protein Q765_12995 [Flavobacterium rivuli WB 3.3-2 = DSM 21788]
MDGGYYAIKGFEFQIDKTILEVLEAVDEDDRINLEQIQDINTADYVMQIKYRETQKYNPSKIREPIIQLLEEFKKNPSSNYYLFCHFQDRPELTSKLTITELNEIFQITIKSNSSKKLVTQAVKINSYTLTNKVAFLDNFFLVFAPKFQDQFEKTISRIRNFSFCNSDDEAVFYYSNIADYFRKIVINNTNVKDRNCSRRELVNYVKSGRKLVFTSSFLEYKGEIEYIKYLKSHFTKPLKNQENFIFIGAVTINDEFTIAQLIVSFTAKFYERATYDIKPPTFIIQSDKINEIKKEILKSNICFNDGFESLEFNPELFFQRPVINRKMQSNRRVSDSLAIISFKFRIISKSSFDKYYCKEINPNRAYYFAEDFHNKLKDNQSIQINNISTKQILNLFNSDK